MQTESMSKKRKGRVRALGLKTSPLFSSLIMSAILGAGLEGAFPGPATRFQSCLKAPGRLLRYGWQLEDDLDFKGARKPRTYRLGDRSRGQLVVFDPKRQVVRLSATGEGAREEFICDLKTGEVLSATSENDLENVSGRQARCRKPSNSTSNVSSSLQTRFRSV